MKVLVTGASGFLGQHLCAALCDEFEVAGTFGSSDTFAEDFPKVAAGAICAAAATKALVGAVAPDAVVHLAALSSPAVCGATRRRRWRSTARALLEALPPLVVMFLSTDQVYDGLRAPYLESSPAERQHVWPVEARLRGRAAGGARTVGRAPIAHPRPQNARPMQKAVVPPVLRGAPRGGTPTDFFPTRCAPSCGSATLSRSSSRCRRRTAQTSGAYNMGGPRM